VELVLETAGEVGFGDEVLGLDELELAGADDGDGLVGLLP
jgi:hypothetical protein